MQQPSADTPANAAAPATQAGDRLKAIGLMCLAVTLFTALDASAKHLATRVHLPVAEIVWFRFLTQFVLILVLVPAFGILSPSRLFTTSRLAHQLVRSVLMVATTAFNFLALQHLRLDQTVTIVFLAPLVVALLAGPVLGERVGARRLAAILVGFLGILIAMRPGFADVHPAVLYSLAAMLAYAIFMLITRVIAAHDPPLVTLFYSMFVGTIAGAPLAFADWVSPPDAFTWALMASLGVLGGAGHYLFILAYRLAPASTIAPFLYMQLISMVAAGYLVFDDVPDAWTMAGAGIVVASGVYLLHNEHRAADRQDGK